MPTLCKQERLFEKRLLATLFGRGKRFSCNNEDGLLRICYLSVPGTEVWPDKTPESPHISCKILVSAPKSRFRHAVDRNRIKRLLREAYRFHKDSFSDLVPEESVLLLSFQFAGGEVSLPCMSRLVEKTAKTLQNRLGHA